MVFERQQFSGRSKTVEEVDRLHRLGARMRYLTDRVGKLKRRHVVTGGYRLIVARNTQRKIVFSRLSEIRLCNKARRRTLPSAEALHHPLRLTHCSLVRHRHIVELAAGDRLFKDRHHVVTGDFAI